MTTQDYLDQLESDREDMVDNLETKGITGLTGDETFTELVPEILNITGGGGATLQSKSVAIVSNGITNVVPDSGYDGLSAVEVSTNVVPVSNVYRVETIAQRNALTGLNSGDMCVVTKNTTGNWEENTSSAEIMFPQTVQLPSAYSNYYYGELRGNNINGMIDFSSSGFRIDGYGDSCDFRVQYESQDGINYTRERLEGYDYNTGDSLVSGDTLTLPEAVSIQSYGDPFDDNVGYFMQTGVETFDGLFTYNNNSWVYSYVGANTNAVDLFNGAVAYTNNGFVVGTLGTTINNDLLKTTYRDICNCIGNYQPTNLGEMFTNYTGSDLSITKIMDTSLVTDMNRVFLESNYITNLDLSGWDTSNVTNMQYMFYHCDILASIDLSSFDTSSVTNMWGMFAGCPLLTSLDLSSFNTSSVTTLQNTFSNCTGLTSLDLSGFNTSSVTNMSETFKNCTSLTSLDLSNFNTSNVTTMWGMFLGCSGLTDLDLSGFDTTRVTSTINMFKGCSSLTSLDLSSFGATPASSISSMFEGCSSLVNLDLSNFSADSVNVALYVFSGCTSLAHLDIRKCDFTHITNIGYCGDMFLNVPNNCLIIVKNNSMKTWITSKWSNLTNVKTVDEYEASLNS